MSESEKDPLDAMLSEYYRDSLAGQQGKSEQGFRAYVARESREAWKRRNWLIGAFASGLAASVAALWALPLLRQEPSRTGVVDPSGATNTAMISPAIERVVQSQTQDDGVIMLDDQTPVRVLHRRGIEKTRWFDQRQAVQAEQTAPRDDLVFVKLKTY